MGDIDQLRGFYVDPTGHGESRFQTWERGEARGDSVTPATYSAAYRRWMYDLLREQLRDRPGGMISVGSGNATIESDIVRAGHRVIAIDIFPEAVELARRKGVEADLADVRDWSPPPGRWTVAYADGLMGHVYDPEVGLQPVLTAIYSWLEPHKGLLVISNDRPSGVTDVQPAAGVPGFHWLSEGFLTKQAEAAGFDQLSSMSFSYRRPLSGVRERAVLTAGTVI